MYRGPCLADISEAEEEANEDSLSSASTASFWSHERELYDPWWRATPPTAAAIRASSSTPPLYRGLVRTAPPTSPVRTRARRPKRSAPTGRSTTPPAHSYAPPRRRARPYGKNGHFCTTACLPDRSCHCHLVAVYEAREGAGGSCSKEGRASLRGGLVATKGTWPQPSVVWCCHRRATPLALVCVWPSSLAGRECGAYGIATCCCCCRCCLPL
ncbi:hypothetical protein E2C01_076680 [Portunus trituberculatus]|uniref:Uncharacterized protein n=1 Tax=Portunus trituberculatus TaxID=210409 RepID=A0A5B7IKB0_PORTR|nr:hypothetical protein [Portunus trituberculatus]